MSVYQTRVEDLELSARTSNTLRRNGCHTLAELLTAGRDKVSLFKNLGAGAMVEIAMAIEGMGFSWTAAGSPPPRTNRPALLSMVSPDRAAGALALKVVADYIAFHCPLATAEQVVAMLRQEVWR